MQKKLLNEINGKGYKVTRQRKQIIEILLQAKSRLTVREIHFALQGQDPGISKDTVYRNLRLLCRLDIVHQISLHSGAVYELSHKHHHHLVCIDCDDIVCFPYCPDSGEYKNKADSLGFDVMGHSFEVYGRCRACRDKKV